MRERGWLAIGSWKGRLAQEHLEGIGEDGVGFKAIWDEGGVERWGWVGAGGKGRHVGPERKTRPSIVVRHALGFSFGRSGSALWGGRPTDGRLYAGVFGWREGQG